ncbi:MAG: PDZ domain-containing protein [Acidobacteriota bacterium]|nr:PDZ domain-containing protein [Acidobacteriota bacterium]
MIHEDSQNETLETEILSASDQKVAQMLGNLRAVDAPKDFDFRLKARIANSTPSHYKPKPLLPILRYAVPLVLVLSIGGMFVLNNSNGIENNALVSGISQPPALIVNPAEAQPPTVNNAEKQLEFTGEIPAIENSGTNKRQLAVGVNAVPKAILARRTGNSSQGGSFNRRPRSPQGGSVDIALKKANPTIYPRGLDPNISINPEKAPGFDNTSKFTVRDILSAIGIEADFGEDAWTVTSLKKGSLAERAGILKGDLIEAIDDRPIGVNAVFTGSVGAKTVTVRRLGRVILLNL